MSETRDAKQLIGAASDAVSDTLNEELESRMRAERLGLEFIDLSAYEIDHDLFESIPVELMFRYNFVPFRKDGERLVVVVADPTDVLMIDELEL
ncbi:MAG: hypothetical protein OEQ13_14655, partial [Acidobacteriota bacterium]|nr:hypothetical protein [Acidobacteriota bacterium]